MKSHKARGMAAMAALGLLTFSGAGCAAIGAVTGGGMYMDRAPTSVTNSKIGSGSPSYTTPAQR